MRLQKLFTPTINQLCQRAVYIMKRLADIGFSILESRSSSKMRYSSSKSSLDDLLTMKGYSYFQSIVRDIFCCYVEKIGKQCNEKCLEELTCSQVLLWEDMKNVQHIVPKKGKQDEINRLLLSLSSKLFAETFHVIIDNILLKSHQLFLVTMQRNLSGEILKDISTFDDALLAEMFNLKASQEHLHNEEERERLRFQLYTEKENQLRDLSTQFSRFKLVSPK